MKCILIDVTKREVREVELDNSIEAIYEQLKCKTFECVWIDYNNAIYIDEEGLLTQTAKSGWFEYEGYHNPIVGNGLIKGVDRESGDDVDTTITLEEVRMKVSFLVPAGRDQ